MILMVTGQEWDILIDPSRKFTVGQIDIKKRRGDAHHLHRNQPAPYHLDWPKDCQQNRGTKEGGGLQLDTQFASWKEPVKAPHSHRKSNRQRPARPITKRLNIILRPTLCVMQQMSTAN